MTSRQYSTEALVRDIWRRPRVAIDAVLEQPSNGGRTVRVVTWVWSFALAYSWRFRDSPTRLTFDSIVQILLLAPAAYLTIILFSTALWQCGLKLGGVATKRAVLSAVVLSRIPLVTALVFSLPTSIVFDRWTEYSKHQGVSIPLSMQVLAVATGAFACIALAFAEVAFYKCLSQVHGFGWKTAFVSQVLTFVVVMIPLALFLGLIVLLANLFDS